MVASEKTAYWSCAGEEERYSSRWVRLVIILFNSWCCSCSSSRRSLERLWKRSLGDIVTSIFRREHTWHLWMGRWNAPHSLVSPVMRVEKVKNSEWTKNSHSNRSSDVINSGDFPYRMVGGDRFFYREENGTKKETHRLSARSKGGLRCSVAVLPLQLPFIDRRLLAREFQ